MNILPLTLLYRRALRAAVMVVLLGTTVATAKAEISEAELVDFVEGYLRAAGQPTPDAEVSHYADRVRYFDSGTVDQAFVAKDQLRYYKLWPERSFELLEGPMITHLSDEAATVRFITRYEVRSTDRRASGTVENTMGVRLFGEELRIVAMSERKVHARSLPQPSERPQQEIPPQTTQPSAPSIKPSPSPAPPSRPPAGPSPRTEKPARQPELRDMPVLPEPPPSKPDAPFQNPEGSPPDKPSGGAAPSPGSALKTATAVPETPGFVYPPGAEPTPKNMLDVRGYSPGQKVRDPRTGQIFLVP